MTLTIGPSIRAQLSSTMVSSTKTAHQRSPAFGDLLAMRAQEQRDGQPQSFAATGMLGKGMRAVEERAHVPTSHGDGQSHPPSEPANGSVIGAHVPDMHAAAAGSSRIDPPGSRPPPPVVTRMPDTRTAAGNGSGIADRPVSSARLSAAEDTDVPLLKPASRLYRDIAGGSETPVQFSAQLSEAGVRVFARLSPLGVAERERLRSAMTHVLAEYGAVSDGITLSEAPHPSDRIPGSGSNGR